MILIVDDKPENIFSLKKLLQLNLFEVDTAMSGEEALKKVLKHEYELIILDVQMPGMDGYEVAEMVTGYSKSQNIPIIFLSAVSIDKRFVTKGYTSGGVDYIVKPFDPDLLILKVRTFQRLYRQSEELNRIKESLEQKVAERTNELLELNKVLEANNAELQQYAYIASHDLQEPLRKISTFSRIIADRFLGEMPEAASYMNRVLGASDRMRSLINDLLSFSKLAQTVEFRPTDLNQVLIETLSDLELTIKDQQAEFVIGNLPTAEMIPSQMKQVFQFFISKALKFIREDIRPLISITSERVLEKSFTSVAADTGAYFRLVITDNGIGFDEQYLYKIFTLFQRLHGNDAFGGTGIGLTIVKKIIDQHSGIITATSVEGEGTSFIMVLPLKQGLPAS